MTIPFEKFRLGLLSNPEVKLEYEALAAEFQKSVKPEDQKQESPPKKSSNRNSRCV